MQVRFKVSLSIIFALTALASAANAQKSSVQDKQRSPTASAPSTSSNKRLPEVNKTEFETEVVRVDTDLVNTLFTAVDKNRHFITTLRPEDIQIYENGVVQGVSLFERETDRPLTLAILIDTSESQKGVLANEKNAARAFVDSVIRPAKDRAAVISFTGAAKVEQQLTSDLARLRKGIERVKVELSPENERRIETGEPPLPPDQDPSGYTGVWDAIWVTIEKILSQSPDQTRRAIILLSDGDDTSSTIKKHDVIDFAVKSDVVIYSMGIRDEDFPYGKLEAGTLRKVSEHTGGRAFFPHTDSDLEGAFAQVQEELRSQYVIGYSPKNKTRDGSYRQVRLEIVNPELRKRKLQLLYREGYYARKQ